MNKADRRKKLERERARRSASAASEAAQSDDLQPRRRRERGVEAKIKEAIEAGEFDNLPGQGQPLRWKPNPYLEPGWELAFDILKNAGFVPDWIDRERAIRQHEATLRARLRGAWLQRGENPAAWAAAMGEAKGAIAKLNRQIDTFNLIVPIVSRQRFRLSLEHELERLSRPGRSGLG